LSGSIPDNMSFGTFSGKWGSGEVPEIQAKDLTYRYDSTRHRALRNVNLEIARGEFAAILGRNGSGKSTLLRHFDTLLPIQAGTLYVCGLDAAGEENHREIRRRCGIVFQNPDNQFVSSVVGEDVAFGLENYGTPEAEIPDRVAGALKLVGMPGFEAKSPQMLSGGQKQRVALAGVLVLSPEVLMFDEATSMLDPQGRREVLETIRKLHREEHKTVVLVTHYVEEAVDADKIVLMDGGAVLAEGAPEEILTDRQLLHDAGLTPPMAVRIYYGLAEKGVRLPFCPLTMNALVDAVCRL